MTAGGETPGPRIALVTGAARGIGRETAARLLADGFVVALADVDQEAARATAAELDPGGGRTVGLGGDVARSTEVDALVAAAAERFGGIDVLVNNAGIAAPEDTAELSDEAWDRILGINLSGALYCSRAAHPWLVRSDSAAIVNVASIAGLVGMRRRAGYSATKAGLIGLTRTLAIEWAGDGIRSNAVAPGYVLTAMIEQQAARGVYSLEEMSSRVPLGRLGAAAEVAGVIAFLASADAAYVTGQTIAVDGGFTVDGRT